jgi:hypothetical protein
MGWSGCRGSTPGPCGGCGPPCATEPIVVCCINDCGSGNAATNVEVQILTGTTVVASGTTDGGGCITFPNLPPGSYNIKTTASNPRYQTFSMSALLACGQTFIITLTTANNFFCSPCFLEPIPSQLTATVNGTAFTILAETPANFYPSNTFGNTLNPSFATNCPPNPTPDPCTEGGTAFALITVDVSTGNVCSVTEFWCQISDCTQNAFEDCPAGPYDFIVGEGFFSEGSGASACAGADDPSPTPQMNEGTCEGYCIAGADATAAIGTGNPVPVNLSLTFVSDPGSPSAPFPTITLTE